MGKIHLCRVHTMHPWPNFPLAADSDPPAGLDWDMWNGPAPAHRYNVTFRNQWHHFWRYSGGDIINNGVHSIDLGRHLCGVEYPRSVHASGGRFDGQGAAETPDTMVVTWDFDHLVMTFEMTLYAPYMIKADRVVRDGDLFPYWPQNGDRVELRRAGTDVYRPGRIGLAGLRAAEEPPAGGDRPDVRPLSRHGPTRTISCTASAPGSYPMPTSARAT